MGKWQNLTALQKAQIIKFAIQNGVPDIKTIRDTYNLYANGGNLPHKKSTGGPLYPFSFERNPFLKTPIVRY